MREPRILQNVLDVTVNEYSPYITLPLHVMFELQAVSTQNLLAIEYIWRTKEQLTFEPSQLIEFSPLLQQIPTL